MLAGLLFATEKVDGADRLVATLPLAGATLIEHQARQLVAAGAAHLVVIAPGATPDLLAAVHRVARRGVPIDLVSGIGEAAAMLHPLARLVMIADGLLATDATVARLADEEVGDALLVVPGALAPASFERIGGGGAWAGIARLDPLRLAEASNLPSDYDPQSTLVRVVAAAGAARVALPVRALDLGHGIERDAVSLQRRGRRLMAGAVTARYGWFDRRLAAPLSRVVVPALATAGVRASSASVAMLLVGVLALAALWWGWLRLGTMLALLATFGSEAVATLATVLEEGLAEAVMRGAVLALPLLALLLIGRWAMLAWNQPLVLATAAAAAIAALLGERAMGRRRVLGGSPPAYLLIAAAAALAGIPSLGLIVAALYAAGTLAAAIERLRRRHA